MALASENLKAEQEKTLAAPRRRYGFLAGLLFGGMDLFYGGGRNLSKFKVLEVIARVPYQAEGERQRHEYRLTTKGVDLYPTLVALMSWGDKYLSDDVAPLELRHKDCGEPVHLALVCDAGHELSSARDVRPVVRPSADAAG